MDFTLRPRAFPVLQRLYTAQIVQVVGATRQISRLHPLPVLCETVGSFAIFGHIVVIWSLLNICTTNFVVARQVHFFIAAFLLPVKPEKAVLLLKNVSVLFPVPNITPRKSFQTCFVSHLSKGLKSPPSHGATAIFLPSFPSVQMELRSFAFAH